MMMKKTLLAIALATLSLNAAAHRGWLLPQVTHVEGKEGWATIDGAISEGLFDIDHVALKLDGATVTDPDGVSTPAPAGYTGKQRSTFDLKMSKSGTYKVSLVNSMVMASYKDASGEVKRFRGPEAQFATDVPSNAPGLRSVHTHSRLETFVTLNEPTEGALKPSGVGLELVPLTHPTDLRPGETAKWRFQLDGKPLPKFAFSLTPAGVRYRGVLGEQRLSTDAKGEVAVKLPSPGMVWVHASYPLSATKGIAQDGPAATRRYTYAATLEILPE